MALEICEYWQHAVLTNFLFDSMIRREPCLNRTCRASVLAIARWDEVQREDLVNYCKIVTPIRTKNQASFLGFLWDSFHNSGERSLPMLMIRTFKLT